MYNQREKKMNTYLMNMLEDHLCVKKKKIIMYGYFDFK